MKRFLTGCAGFILFVAIAAMAAASPAEKPSTPPPPAAPAPVDEEIVRMNRVSQEISARTHLAHESGSPLAELLVLKSLEAEYAGNDFALGVLRMMISQLLPQVGDYAGAHRYADLSEGSGQGPGAPRPALPPLGGYAPENAIQAIAKAAGSRQVVMINEAHHVPQHRAFTLQLLGELRKQGFAYFAAETLRQDPGLVRRGYPTKETGWYIQEPLYGDLVRTALRLGYKVVPYEQEEVNPGQDPGLREREQARHLVERILKADPKAKVLVHAGYGHVAKSGSPMKMMASYFHEMTGIDPLAINQVLMTEHSAPELEEPLYRQAVDRGLVKEPVVFRNAAGALWSTSKNYDMAVFHPRSRYENGRPDWLRIGGLRAPQPLPGAICGPSQSCLVKAHAAGEKTDAIPLDEIIAESGRPLPALMLPRGKFLIRVDDARGKQIGERTMAIR
jgi:hypothetical protein